MSLKVLNIRDFLVSHILLVGGLVLVTMGLLQPNMNLNVIGIWTIALGLCLAIGNGFKRLSEKK